LGLNQLGLDAIGRLAEFPALGFLPAPLQTALFQRCHQRFQLLIQQVDTGDRILLFLANPLKIALAMLPGRPSTLHSHLSFGKALLKALHALIHLLHTYPDGLQSAFLPVFFRDPLHQLRLSGSSFLLQPLHFQQTAPHVIRQGLDPLRKINKEVLETGRIFLQRQGLHLFLTQGFCETTAFFAQRLSLRLQFFALLACLFDVFCQRGPSGFQLHHFTTAL